MSSSEFLRKSLLYSFVGALALIGGVVLHHALQEPVNQAPSAIQNLDLVGRLAPEIRLAGIDNQEFLLSQHRGQWVLVNFWASWCPPCVEEIPILMEMQDRYDQLEIAGVAIDDLAPLIQFNEHFKFNYPVLPTTISLMEQYGNIIGTMPYSVLIDPQGIIAMQHFKPFKREELVRILTTRLEATP